MGHFDELCARLAELREVEALEKALATQHPTPSPVRRAIVSRDALAQIRRSAERLKTAVVADQKPEPLVMFKAMPAPRPVRLHDIARSGRWDAIPPARHQR